MMKQVTLHKALLLPAVLMAGVAATSCEDYDLDEKLPPNFGSTVYDYLQRNDYEDFTRLVQELGYEEALSGRSSKTMFVANDEAFRRFYQSNPWGVHSYDELSKAQKKLLLYSSMVDNSLQIMNLSSTTGVSGVVKGNAMRRSTATSVYDTVPLLRPAEMPDNAPAWRYYREAGKSLYCMKDMTTVPLMFFVEQFLHTNRITNEDMDFLFNHERTRVAGEARINGEMVVEPNIRCANGFLHRTENVLLPLDNMAELLRKNANTRTYSRLVERFSAPAYVGRDATNSYNLEYGTDVDSVFQKRYFSDRSIDGLPFSTTADGTVVSARLKFDPGWNSFFSDDPNAVSNTVAMQQNMGVMLVPSDAALEEYWENGVGRVLKDNYGTWDNVPDLVVSKLLNNNMLNSFTNSVPSKFDGIVNSTQDPMGIRIEDVDSVFLGCNGAIYLTNKVFSPTEYVSVLFPALVNESMKILYWAVDRLQYGSYLNSLDSYYSFFVPTNDALLQYIDPVSYGQTETLLWKFYYEEQATNDDEHVWASVWTYDLTTGEVGDSLREVRYVGDITNRLQDVLDNHIVVGNVESGKEYYRTKNGGVVRVATSGGNVTGVQSSLQMDKGETLRVANIYDQSVEGNGKTYILEDAPLMTTRRSVFDILDTVPQFSLFYSLMLGSDLFETSRMGMTTGSAIGNVASFNNYHYTVYVPSNESLQALIDSGDLPTWDQIADMESNPGIPEEMIESEKKKINEFVRYHVQDNSLYLGMDFSNDGAYDTFERNYETAIMNMETNKFYTISAHMTPDGLTLTDGLGRVRRVVQTPGLYNLSAREYQINGNSISTSAFAVVHQIDAPLFFKASQCPHYNK